MLSKDEILSIIQSELQDATYSTTDGTSLTSLETSLNYYLGGPNGKEIKGRSQVTSTDVADAIEWILPQIMKSFTQNNEIVEFDAVIEGDEKQALLESQYVYEILMKQNDGFIILHQFVKDALMQRNGILKVYYAKYSTTKCHDWTCISEEQLTQALSHDGVELLEKTEYTDEEATAQRKQELMSQIESATQSGQFPPEVIASMHEEASKPIIKYDVRIAVERSQGKIYVDPIPPEEFRVNTRHNSICLDNARFTAHVTEKVTTDVIEEFGLDLEQTRELPEGYTEYDREYRFAMQEESVFYRENNHGDESQRYIGVSECFMQLDIDQTGVSKLMKVTCAGQETVSDIIKVEEVNSMPWISTTTFLMSHKWQGLSVTDRLREIQDQKTALWRNSFDNLYLQNNQRTAVIESQVEMNDLLVSRPGNVVRVKRLDAIQPLVTPSIGQDAANMMNYLDRVRAGRTGVDPDGTATPDNIGDRVGSEGVARLMNAKEELVGLIIRVIAETGIKPLMTKIRNECVMHQDAVTDFRFRGIWYKVDPATWPDRVSCTVRVGTGSGNHQEQLGAIREVLALQKEIIANPQQTLTDQKRLFAAVDDFCRFSGLNGAHKYFVDPESPEGQQMKEQNDKSGQENQAKEDKIQQIMVESQMKIAEAEEGKVKVSMANTQLKAQNDQQKNQLQLQKQTNEARLDEMQRVIDRQTALIDMQGQDADRRLKKYEIDQRTAVELTKLEREGESDENENFEENKETVSEQS